MECYVNIENLFFIRNSALCWSPLALAASTRMFDRSLSATHTPFAHVTQEKSFDKTLPSCLNSYSQLKEISAANHNSSSGNSESFERGSSESHRLLLGSRSIKIDENLSLFFGMFHPTLGVCRRLFSMSREGHTSGEISSQTGYPVRWAVFALMWIFGMMTIVMGMTTQEAGRDWKYLSVYLTWTLATAVFVFLDMKPTKTFVIHKCLYLASIGTVFWFVCAVLKINPDTIPVYIPMCTNLGIFLGIGFDHVWSSSQAKVRRTIHIAQASIAHARAAEGGNEEELPLHLTSSLGPGNPSPLPHNGEDGSAVEQQS